MRRLLRLEPVPLLRFARKCRVVRKMAGVADNCQRQAKLTVESQYSTPSPAAALRSLPSRFEVHANPGVPRRIPPAEHAAIVELRHARTELSPHSCRR